jgi:urease subunit gamma/beta
MRPGEVFPTGGTLELNAGRPRTVVRVANTGDRPIQVGSHYHFFEVNRHLVFNRAAAYGLRLDVPAGTAARFEPGDERDVTLVPIGGRRRVYGLNGLVNGDLDDPATRQAALAKAKREGFETS